MCTSITKLRDVSIKKMLNIICTLLIQYQLITYDLNQYDLENVCYPSLLAHCLSVTLHNYLLVSLLQP